MADRRPSSLTAPPVFKEVGQFSWIDPEEHEDDKRSYDPDEHLARRHLPGKHNQKDHAGKGHGSKSAGIDAKAVEGDLVSGKPVTVHPDDVDDLMKEFSDGPVFNLKHMQVSGAENKNCFKKALREIPRSQMPQLPQSVEEIGAFRAKLAEHGISATLETVDPRSLVATQNELNAQKVAKIFGSIRQSGWNEDNIMFISREGAVLDGHHRWAGASAAAMAGTRVKMKTIRVDTDIDTLLAIANTVSLAKKSLARSRVDFGEEPTSPPPDENKPWIWLDGRWYFVVTDTGDGVPEELSFPEEETPRFLPWGTYDARYNKAHDKAGKFATTAGGGATYGGSKIQVLPVKDHTGKVIGSFEFDPTKPAQPQIDAVMKRFGATSAHMETKSQRTVRDQTGATPPKPRKMKSAKTTTKGTTTTAVHDGEAEFPKRKAGTKTVTPGKGRRLTPEEFETLSGGTKVTADEKKAMDFYDLPRGGGSGSGAHDMNWKLRGGRKSTKNGRERAFDPKTDEYNRSLMSAISRHKAPVDMVVTRRVGISGLGVDVESHPDYQWGWGESKASASARRRGVRERALAGLPGSVIQDKGFVSTTLRHDIPGGGSVFGEHKLEIQVPKGTPLIHLNNPEQEIVFGPNTKIAILGIRKEGDSWIIPAQIVR